MRIVDDDDELRAAITAFLSTLAARTGGIATWKDLQGFTFKGRRIPLIGQKGIRKVRGYPATAGDDLSEASCLV